MRIKINGEWQDFDGSMSVAELLKVLSLEPLRVAVERNCEIVRRAAFGDTQVVENDEIEIVTLVGGG